MENALRRGVVRKWGEGLIFQKGIADGIFPQQPRSALRSRLQQTSSGRATRPAAVPSCLGADSGQRERLWKLANPRGLASAACVAVAGAHFLSRDRHTR